jgi:hypothetical protein
LIEEPDRILESPTVLKIVTAKKVKLEFEHRLKNSNSTKSYFKAYTVLKNKIETATDIDWERQKIDAAAGQDALIIFA